MAKASTGHLTDGPRPWYCRGHAGASLSCKHTPSEAQELLERSARVASQGQPTISGNRTANIAVSTEDVDQAGPGGVSPGPQHAEALQTFTSSSHGKMAR